jgi:hypothetical protein
MKRKPYRKPSSDFGKPSEGGEKGPYKHERLEIVVEQLEGGGVHFHFTLPDCIKDKKSPASAMFALMVDAGFKFLEDTKANLDCKFVGPGVGLDELMKKGFFPPGSNLEH